VHRAILPLLFDAHAFHEVIVQVRRPAAGQVSSMSSKNFART
jgi:hypothetical protein